MASLPNVELPSDAAAAVAEATAVSAENEEGFFDRDEEERESPQQTETQL